MSTFESRLRPILDGLAEKAWAGAAHDQEGPFLLRVSDVSVASDEESLREALGALYKHARRWAPGLSIPFFVPPVRIGVPENLAGNFVVDEENHATVGLWPELLQNEGAVLSTLAHEACHHILDQSGLSPHDDELNEITTELATFVCGFGELALQGSAHVEYFHGGHRKIHLGYLSPEEIQRAHEHVLAKRILLGLPVGSSADGPAALEKEPAAPALEAGGAIELHCGEALCKRAFRAELRRDGKPWPVQCPVCGVSLYPADVLRAAAAHELAPQHAEMRLSRGGSLVEVTSAILWKLARPVEAVAAVDGAAILAEIIEATPGTAEPAARLPDRHAPARTTERAAPPAPVVRLGVACYREEDLLLLVHNGEDHVAFPDRCVVCNAHVKRAYFEHEQKSVLREIFYLQKTVFWLPWIRIYQERGIAVDYTLCATHRARRWLGLLWIVASLAALAAPIALGSLLGPVSGYVILALFAVCWIGAVLLFFRSRGSFSPMMLMEIGPTIARFRVGQAFLESFPKAGPRRPG
jgi:hypothetical protein